MWWIHLQLRDKKVWFIKFSLEEGRKQLNHDICGHKALHFNNMLILYSTVSLVMFYENL